MLIIHIFIALDTSGIQKNILISPLKNILGTKKCLSEACLLSIHNMFFVVFFWFCFGFFCFFGFFFFVCFCLFLFITKTGLFKYIENFTSKNRKCSDKKSLIFFIFLLQTYIVGTR